MPTLFVNSKYTYSHTWTQMDIPEPRPKPRYGQSQLYLDENHILMLGGCGGPTQVYHDVWLLVMKYPHWKWVECDIKNPENRAENLWLHPACKVQRYLLVPLNSLKNLMFSTFLCID